MLVARFVGPLATLFVDADDIVHTAAVARHANHHSGWTAHFFWKQEIREHADAGLAVEHDLLAHVTGKCTCVECDRAKRRSSRWEASHELSQLRSERFLPGLGFAAIARAESKLPRGSRVQIARVRDRVESAVLKIRRHSGERPDIGGLDRGLRVEPHGMRGCQSASHSYEITARKLGHGFRNLQSPAV